MEVVGNVEELEDEVDDDDDDADDDAGEDVGVEVVVVGIVVALDAWGGGVGCCCSICSWWLFC